MEQLLKYAKTMPISGYLLMSKWVNIVFSVRRSYTPYSPFWSNCAVRNAKRCMKMKVKLEEQWEQ